MDDIKEYFKNELLEVDGTDSHTIYSKLSILLSKREQEQKQEKEKENENKESTLKVLR